MQKTKISPSWLTPVEQKELERRGFLVKNIKSWQSLLGNIFLSLLIFPIFFAIVYILLSIPILLFGYLWLSLVFIKVAIFIPFISYAFFLGRYLWTFWRSKKAFYLKDQFISFWDLQNNQSLNEYISYLDFFGILFLKIKTTIGNYFYIDPRFTGFRVVSEGRMYMYIIAFMISLLYILLIAVVTYHYYLIITSFIALCFTSTILTNFLYLISPLYAFWNLWSKIQSLTPRISESSEKIQKEFSTDMNFSVLSNWFATLASDFSKISGYVLKLEQIEKKANKWNLFDSEKYIGSLREDILTPLISLKKFLEQKKIELEASREELKDIQSQRQRVQVQVGWPDTLTGNTELQSKRTEPLIIELTENIEKLGTMIEKFGKV